MTPEDDHGEDLASLTARVAALRPAGETADLGRALLRLAARHAREERRGEALALTLESAQIFRTLALSDAVAHGLALASALNLLSERLDDVGQTVEARQIGGDAVALARAASDGDEDVQAHLVLMAALLNQAGRSWGAGENSRALAEMTDAVAAFRDGGDGLVPYFSLLVDALHANAMALAGAKLWPDAVAVRRLLVSCFAANPPPQVRHLLALSLQQAAHGLSVQGQAGEGLPWAEEALALARGLAADDPATYGLFLGQSLSNLACRQYEAGAALLAVDVAMEAISCFQDAARTDAPATLAPLAQTLETFAAILTALGQHDQAQVILAQRDSLLAVASAAAPVLPAEAEAAPTTVAEATPTTVAEATLTTVAEATPTTVAEATPTTV